jgi:hypothetical protein
MKEFLKSMRWRSQLLAIFVMPLALGLTVAAERPHSTVPEQLQGRQSYWIQERPFLSKTEISRKLSRPRGLHELLKNLHVVWTGRLLVEQNFYDDSILMTCFNGTHLTWRDGRTDPTGEYSIRMAEMELDARAFPHAVVVVRIQREKVEGPGKALPYFPAHQHYVAYFDLSVKGIDAFTWEEVTDVFGQNATSLPQMIIDGPAVDRPSTVAQMRYSYPGDDPTKFGYVELPQTKIWLSGQRPDIPAPEKEKPRGSDKVTRIYMLEASNRVQGED